MKPIIKSLIFTVIVPGSTVSWVPALLVSWWSAPLPVDLGLVRFLGVPLVIGGAGMYFWCAWDFAVGGEGTPAVFDPPRRLVVRGLYRCTRNPMYVGLVILLAGEAIAFDSSAIFLYALAAALAFHVFIVSHEEPYLRKRFGDEYRLYTERVNRWWPSCPGTRPLPGE